MPEFNANAVRRISRSVHWTERFNIGRQQRQGPSRRSSFVGHDGREWHLYRNDSGETVPAHGLLRPTGMATYLDDQQVLTMAKPNSATATGDNEYTRYYAVNGPVEVAGTGDSELYGACTFDPLARVFYDSTNTPAYGESWGHKTGQWKVYKGRPGFTILGVLDSTNFIALARQQEVIELWGTLDGALEEDGNESMSVFFPDGSSSAWTDSTEDIKVYDRLLNAADADHDSGVWYVARWYGTRWYGPSSECNA